jgi:DNA-directed RNA polymerase subunit K
MAQILKQDFTQYEKARVLGARALQIAMDAPLLKEISKEELEKMHYDPMKIAEMELDGEFLPITVKQPFPKKRAVQIKKIKQEDKKEEDVVEKEEEEEKEIAEKGEIMELANPDDEEEPSEEIEEEQ